MHSCAHALSTVADLHPGLANGIAIDHVMPSTCRPRSRKWRSSRVAPRFRARCRASAEGFIGGWRSSKPISDTGDAVRVRPSGRSPMPTSRHWPTWRSMTSAIRPTRGLHPPGFQAPFRRSDVGQGAAGRIFNPATQAMIAEVSEDGTAWSAKYARARAAQPAWAALLIKKRLDAIRAFRGASRTCTRTRARI